jgi:hypothetical protein
MAKDLKTTLLTVAMILGLVLATGTNSEAGQQQFRRLAVKDYVDKMKAGWIGQMAGVGWGGPTEFRWRGQIIPKEKMPKWKPELINQFKQDDIYVEMTFLRTLELYGLDASVRQAGIDFANSGYMLWHANKYGRDNLREGIAPPDSGHPKFSAHADDIDYQIEADYAGLISPGMPNMAIELGEIFGRLMNYGDGLYGGQFVAGMYAEAFFEDDIEKIVRAGLHCIPEGSQYYECIADVLKWWKENPNDWEKTWQLIEDKYQDNPDYRKFSCDKGDFNIDAKINGAYIVMGLLYGEGDLDKTIIISTRCGQDSDCNPSNAAGVLFTTIGFEQLPEKFTSALDPEGKFSHTPYNFPLLVHVCESLSRAAIIRAGGRVERDDKGNETFVIPVGEPKPSALEQCWEPGPIANSRFTEAELVHIDPPPTEEDEGDKAADVQDLDKAVAKIAPGWAIKNCLSDEFFGLHNEFDGRVNVLATHPPKSGEVPCTIYKRVKIPGGGAKLHLTVGYIELLDWLLVVKANGDEVLKTVVGSDTAEGGWRNITVDLSKYAGSEIMLELQNASNDASYEIALWTKIQIDSD